MLYAMFLHTWDIEILVEAIAMLQAAARYPSGSYWHLVSNQLCCILIAYFHLTTNASDLQDVLKCRGLLVKSYKGTVKIIGSDKQPNNTYSTKTAISILSEVHNTLSLDNNIYSFFLNVLSSISIGQCKTNLQSGNKPIGLPKKEIKYQLSTHSGCLKISASPISALQLVHKSSDNVSEMIITDDTINVDKKALDLPPSIQSGLCKVIEHIFSTQFGSQEISENSIGQITICFGEKNSNTGEDFDHSISISGKIIQLQAPSDSGCQAALFAIRSGQAEKAVEFIEENQATLWSQALSHHCSYNNVENFSPDFANKFEPISTIQESPSSSKSRQTTVSFPVIYLIPDDTSSSCLIKTSTNVYHIPLPNLPNQKLHELARRIQLASKHSEISTSALEEWAQQSEMHFPFGGYSESEQLGEKRQRAPELQSKHLTGKKRRIENESVFISSDEVFAEVLTSLWYDLVKPVIDLLEICVSVKIYF